MRNPSLVDELCKTVAEHVRAEIPVPVNAVCGLESRGNCILKIFFCSQSFFEDNL